MISLLDFRIKAERPLYADDFNREGYFLVEYGGSGLALNEWTIVHRWCAEHFGPQVDLGQTTKTQNIVSAHYTWIGSHFWFDRREDANHFKAKWVSGAIRWAEDYDWAIQIEDLDEFRAEMDERFGITIYDAHNGWAAIETDEHLVRARLVRPDADIVCLKGLVPTSKISAEERR